MVFPDRSKRQAVALLLFVSFGLACGGGSDAVNAVLGQELTVQFAPSSTSAAAELVYLRSGAAQGETITVDIEIGGPTTSSDLYSFAFDLVLGDPSVVEYIPGSAVFGDALTIGGSQGTNVLASQSGNRVVIGVSKTGGGPGNGITNSENTVVSVSLRILRTGTSSIVLDGPPFGGSPAVLDSAGVAVPGVSFDRASATIIAL